MREIRVQLLQKVFSFWGTSSPRPPDFAPPHSKPPSAATVFDCNKMPLLIAAPCLASVFGICEHYPSKDQSKTKARWWRRSSPT